MMCDLQYEYFPRNNVLDIWTEIIDFIEWDNDGERKTADVVIHTEIDMGDK